MLPFAWSISLIDDIPLPWFAAMIFAEIALYAVLKLFAIPLERRHDVAVSSRQR